MGWRKSGQVNSCRGCLLTFMIAAFACTFFPIKLIAVYRSLNCLFPTTYCLVIFIFLWCAKYSRMKLTRYVATNQWNQIWGIGNQANANVSLEKTAHMKLKRPNKFDHSWQDNGKNVDKSFFINVLGAKASEQLTTCSGHWVPVLGTVADVLEMGISCEILSLCY